jgi:hypothetical protein
MTTKVDTPEVTHVRYRVEGRATMKLDDRGRDRAEIPAEEVTL